MLQSRMEPRPAPVFGSTSIQLRRPEVDSAHTAGGRAEAVLDHDEPSYPSGSGDRDPMPSSVSSVSGAGGSFSRPRLPSDERMSANPRGTGLPDCSPASLPRFQIGGLRIGKSSPPPGITTSGNPDAGFVQQPTAGVGSSELPPRSAAPPPAPPALRCCWTRLSISRRARSTLSGAPTTSNTGSVPRDGVTMYVCVSCWIRFTVDPFGPTTKPTDLTGTRTSQVT